MSSLAECSKPLCRRAIADEADFADLRGWTLCCPRGGSPTLTNGRRELPAPHPAVVGIDHFTEKGEAAFSEHARGCILLRQRVRTHDSNSVLERELRQRAGRLGGVSAA